MARTREQDACPGALQVHRAADGALARIRLPGGVITAAQLETLARAAIDWAAGTLELTSRGNLQIRGVTDAAAVADAAASAGLLPSPTHERVRNIVASPLSGRVGATTDIRALITELDEAICADPALAALPGRFLFGIDDGRADISGLGADVGIHFQSDAAGDTAALLLAGRDTGVRLALNAAVPAMVELAQRFAASRGTAWRVKELVDPDILLGELPRPEAPGATWPAVTRPPVGWLDQHDGRVTLGAAAPLGVLPARTAEYLAAIGAPMAITPWRSILVFDLDEGVADVALRVLAPLGLVFDENSPWLSVSACTGSPGCEHSMADVRADAAAAVVEPASAHATGNPIPGHRHFVGCDRACGSPPTGEVLVATGDGYRARDTHP
ncbi:MULTISPECIES: precorrin-3B synthase [unclassified Mycobacterium]|uniref:precorrin-3B synthase n=1 Tax=unclassified Mycobacterium TaxID=2642494 RepID=UPI0007400F38|nr:MULTISPECIES: precorrin-3B synthase [unclassified Mycobacterium]KUH81012.1 precorrin-3B synthase [Mycobacterium sp. GA-1999]KUH89888.1 precorrin-3B synthase [Mycobacterium sp. GA-0227b]